MPCLTNISGIRICVNSNDHLPPHIHAIYGEYEVLISIREIDAIKGALPKNKMKVALNYVRENSFSLLEVFYQLNPHINPL
jgi:Domain of unknown function (DUF4160)